MTPCFYGLTQKELMENQLVEQLLKKRAVLLHNKMGGNEDFQASEGWLNILGKRHGIHVLCIYVEKLSSDREEATNFFKKFEQLVKKKALLKEQVYNVDETGLYHRMLPTKTLASRKEAAEKRSKDRVNVSLCGNAAGTVLCFISASLY
ncbi:hypothetical protein AVEN_251860-1 [Araneus ventricosus]|uniref:HTH CENPB-type domain-containing protein n=1 Tax=Araneus ventricosus TaxID=182803 RepID=A0A4Y2FXM2_ARAVE|nr:hypothetical protein AVEN_251860-1 [Araneus ventricosus]